jgi:hypothetical protein
MTASTCLSTGLGTQISVFSTDGTCVNGNNNVCSTPVAWSSNAGEIYTILVHGQGSAFGNFLLQITTDGPALAASDFCANAASLQLNEDFFIDLSQATEDGDLVGCSTSGIPVAENPIGNFYKVIGNGNSMTTLLESDNEFDLCGTGMAVLSGSSCSDLSCVVSGCLDCRWDSVEGLPYYIYVHYFEGLGGVPDGFMTLTVIE